MIYVYQSGTISGENRPNIVSCDIFDTQWNHLPFRQKTKNAASLPPAPANLDRMLEISRCLSDKCAFLRVDLYEINDQIYVGELTLFPGGGFSPFYPAEWDAKIGEWIKMPLEKT